MLPSPPERPRSLALALAGSVLSLTAIVATAGPASAATTTSWNATGTQADVVGSWAHGTATLTPSTESYAVTMTVTDSQPDHASGRAYFRWRYAWGEVSGAGVITASGYQNSTSKTWQEPRGNLDSYQPFEVKECRVDNGIEVECGGWDVPYPFN
ncbi:hypothetical protein [Streptomyces sp. NBC_01190]|uniref:hypothetical protein n=1 Tax=Streptomyces sp. NBC_01190 TaxID=2903767 RepID=UPI00386B97B8|nr:hypothetical protein OG519_33850 [Streptomyces sp. NBC_01190]